MFRPLKAKEIDVRVSNVNQKFITLLLYQDARCARNILDETVGAYNWQRKHKDNNKNCIVSIWDEEKRQWVEKEDTGVESSYEKAKGLASDSFKRACVCWGIGTELYTAPTIRFDGKKENWIYREENKYKTNETFKIKDISYNKEREIIAIEVFHKNSNKTIFTWKEGDKICEDKIDKIKDTAEEILLAKTKNARQIKYKALTINWSKEDKDKLTEKIKKELEE